MRTQIDTPFRDAAASDLRLALGDAPGAPLAVLPVTFGTVTLNLRVLDASHSVQLDADTTQICEVVGVLPREVGSELPRFERRQLPGAIYTISSFARPYDVSAVERDVDAVAANPYGIVAELSGEPGGVTAIVAGTGVLRTVWWRTLHAYPKAGETVETTTRVVLL